RWGKADRHEIRRVLVHCAIFALVIALIATLMLWKGSIDHIKLVLGALASAYVVRGVAMYVVKRWRGMPRGRRYPAEMAGMLLAHLGVGIFIAGALLSQALSVQKDVRMEPGQTQVVGSYTFRFDGVEHAQGPNWTADEGTITVFNGNGKQVKVLHPQKRTYPRGQVQTEAAIAPGVTHDLYTALGEPLDSGAGNAWSVRIYYKPFVHW